VLRKALGDVCEGLIMTYQRPHPGNLGVQVVNLLPEDEESFRFKLASMGADLADTTEQCPTLDADWSPYCGADVE
jgi:hypothetical protein